MDHQQGEFLEDNKWDTYWRIILSGHLWDHHHHHYHHHNHHIFWKSNNRTPFRGCQLDHLLEDYQLRNHQQTTETSTRHQLEDKLGTY